MSVPVSVPGCVALVCCKTTSTFSPRAWLRICAKEGLRGQIDGEALQRAFDGGVGVVGDGGDVAAVEVAQDHGLEQVVDVADGEGQIDAGVAFDGAFALEVADAAGEQHHLADGQLRHQLRSLVAARVCSVRQSKAGATERRTRPGRRAPPPKPARNHLRPMIQLP